MRLVVSSAAAVSLVACAAILGLDDVTYSTGAGDRVTYGAPELVADGMLAVTSIAADETATYWGASERLVRAFPGSPATVIAQSALPIVDVALAPGWVVWMTKDGLHVLSRSVDDAGRVDPLDGGRVSTVLPAREVATDTTTAYFTNRGQVGRFRFSSGTFDPCPTPTQPSHVAWDGTRVLFFGPDDAGTSLLEVRSKCAEPSQVVPNLPSPRALQADLDGQYWIDARGVVMAQADAAVRPAFLTDVDPRSLAVQGDTLYVATVSKIVAYTKGSGALADVAAGQRGPTAVAATPGAVYWATEDGKILRAAVSRTPR